MVFLERLVEWKQSRCGAWRVYKYRRNLFFFFFLFTM